MYAKESNHCPLSRHSSQFACFTGCCKAVTNTIETGFHVFLLDIVHVHKDSIKIHFNTSNIYYNALITFIIINVLAKFIIINILEQLLLNVLS